MENECSFIEFLGHSFFKKELFELLSINQICHLKFLNRKSNQIISNDLSYLQSTIVLEKLIQSQRFDIILKIIPFDFNKIELKESFLYRLIQQNQFEIIQYLKTLHSKYKWLDFSSRNNIAIRIASRNGHLSLVKYFLSLKSEFPKIDPSDSNNDAITGAANNGHLDVLKFLISLKKEFPKIDPSSNANSAILLASEFGQLDVVQYLCTLTSQFPRIDPSDQQNHAVRSAAVKGHFEVVKFLCSLKTQFPTIDPSSGQNWALRMASSNGHLEIVKFLLYLDPKIFPNIRPTFGMKAGPWTMAANNGHIHILEWIVSVKTDFPHIIPTENSQSGIDTASSNGHVQTVKWLLEFWKEDKKKFTSLVCDAFESAGTGQVMQYVLNLKKEQIPLEKSLGDVIARAALNHSHLQILETLVENREIFSTTISKSFYDQELILDIVSIGRLQQLEFFFSLRQKLIFPNIKFDTNLFKVALENKRSFSCAKFLVSVEKFFSPELDVYFWKKLNKREFNEQVPTLDGRNFLENGFEYKK